LNVTDKEGLNALDRLLSELSDDEHKSDDGSFGSFSMLQFSAEIPVTPTASPEIKIEPSSPQKFVRSTDSPVSSPKSDFVLRRTTSGAHRLSDANSNKVGIFTLNNVILKFESEKCENKNYGIPRRTFASYFCDRWNDS
jgi:hypothetical protein